MKTKEPTYEGRYHGENKVGHAYTGEREWDGWFIYQDNKGQLYGSKEIPVYYIRMDNSRQVMTENGKLASRTKREIKNDCLGLSWEEIEKRQGGRLKR